MDELNLANPMAIADNKNQSIDQLSKSEIDAKLLIFDSYNANNIKKAI